jgi:hypothetical protein
MNDKWLDEFVGKVLASSELSFDEAVALAQRVYDSAALLDGASAAELLVTWKMLPVHGASQVRARG